jgi:hypothetical protein
LQLAVEKTLQIMERFLTQMLKAGLLQEDGRAAAAQSVAAVQRKRRKWCEKEQQQSPGQAKTFEQHWKPQIQMDW